MPPAVIAIVAIVAIAIPVVMWLFSDTQRIKRAMRNEERVTIAQYPEGGVNRIVGRLSLDGEALEAPLTGRSCAAYEVVVEERRSNGNNSSSWYTVTREVRTVPFVLSDATGRARVDPAGAELVITSDERSRSGSFDDATPREEAFLASQGEKSEGWVFNRALRYREGVLEPDEQVAVVGHGTRTGEASGSSPALEIRASAGVSMYISDDTSVLS